MGIQNDNEVWKPVVGFEGVYEVSSFGRIRSLRRTIRHGRTKAPSIRNGVMLCFGKQSSGHLFFQLPRPGGAFQTTRVHRVVAAAFLGPCPPGLQVNHIDGNPANNRIENLEYCTHAENMRHARDVLRAWPVGELHYNAKLTEDGVRKIRTMRASGMTFQAIADTMGIGRKTASRACYGECWGHVV